MKLRKYFLGSLVLFILILAGFSTAGSIFEGFENNTFPPTGWTTKNNGGTQVWARVTVAPLTGAADASVRYDLSSVLGVDWLITPRLNGIVPGDSLVFWMSRVWQSTNLTWDSTYIMVSTTNTDTTSFTSILELGIDDADTNGHTYPPRSPVGGGTTGLYKRYAISLEDYVGDTLFIAWRNFNVDGTGIRLDDVLLPGVLTAIEPITQAPINYSLKQNYPNPFNPSTTISFSIPKQEFVSLKVYDLLGKEITSLVGQVKQAGSYDIRFDASGLPSGLYIYRLEAGSFIETRKMQLIK